MGIDYLVQLDCAPRRAFAGADLQAGSVRIMEMVKASAKARMIADLAQKQGKPRDAVTVRSVRILPTGPVEVDLTYADVAREAAPLGEQAQHCRGCPANAGGGGYGCYGSIAYPIPPPAEEWLVARLQAPDTVGGRFLHSAIADFGYDGAKVRSYRERKLFSAPTPATRSWKTGIFSSKRVTVDQIWQALLTVGPLQPSHAGMVLLWLGALVIDGRVPTAPGTDAALVQRMLAQKTADARRQLAVLDLGPPPTDRATASVRALVEALYVAWAHDAVLFVDA